jgi:hypothetical protein
VVDIAEQFHVHHSYPTLLARRRGIPTRLKRKNIRYASRQTEEPTSEREF